MVMSSWTIFAQTNTTTSGTWNDATIWSAGVPGVTTTATVNHPTEINTNLSISTGAYTFNQSATDFAGGTEYSLTKNNTGSLTVNSGAVVNFNAACSITDGTITVNAGGTLIITAPADATGLSLPNDASLDFYIYGTLIIYGNVENKNNLGAFVVDGLMELRPIPGCGVCAGNFDNQTGSVTISGTGEIAASGSITNTGASTTFGSNNDCATGPCSGQSLCLGNGVNVVASNQYICSGGSAAALTGDAVAGVTGYKWQSSTTSATSGFGGTLATTQNYNPGTPAQTTWYRRLVTTASCTDRPSLAVVITIIPTASWRGTTSTDWNVTSNWCSGTLPTNATDVVIPAGVPNQPTVSAATVALCRNLTISTGASVTINSTRQINVSGNLINNGTLSVSGIIQFNGSSAQTISGNGFSSWGTVIVNNSSGATPALTIPTAGINVVTQLTLTAGKINLSSANLTIGTAVGTPGTLSYSGGYLYGGNITRWIGPGALTLGNTPGQFPIGSTADYRPAYFGSTSVTTGGTIRVNHTASSGATDITDFADNDLTTVRIRSNSFWTVATGNSMPANTFDLRTEGTGFGTVTNVSHLRLIRVTSVVPAASGTGVGTNGGSLTNPQVNRTSITTTNLNNNFYWGSTNLTTSLPVSVISFNGRQTLNQIELDWATASELNFDYFEIERSANAKDFVSIGKVTGHGNSNVRNDYRLADEKPLIGKNYYRLKSIDFDGYTEYFDIVAVDFSTTKSFFISPNPSDGTSLGFTLNFVPEANTSIIIYDNLSNVVGYYPPVSYSENITFSNVLKSSVYFAKFISGDFVKVERFVVR